MAAELPITIAGLSQALERLLGLKFGSDLMAVQAMYDDRGSIYLRLYRKADEILKSWKARNSPTAMKKIREQKTKELLKKVPVELKENTEDFIASSTEELLSVLAQYPVLVFQMLDSFEPFIKYLNGLQEYLEIYHRFVPNSDDLQKQVDDLFNVRDGIAAYFASFFSGWEAESMKTEYVKFLKEDEEFMKNFTVTDEDGKESVDEDKLNEFVEESFFKTRHSFSAIGGDKRGRKSGDAATVEETNVKHQFMIVDEEGNELRKMKDTINAMVFLDLNPMLGTSPLTTVEFWRKAVAQHGANWLHEDVVIAVESTTADETTTIYVRSIPIKEKEEAKK